MGIIGNIVNGAYRAVYGDVPKNLLPYQLEADKSKGNRGRKAYRVYMETYTQLGFSGKTFKKGRKVVKGTKDNTVKVLRTRGRCYYNLDGALKRIQHLESTCPNNVSIVLIRLWDENPRSQVLQRKIGTAQKK